MEQTIRPFGPKARRFIRRHPDTEAQITILNGAVRSAKTWAINAKLVSLLVNGWWPGGLGLITGISKATIRNNILNDVFAWVGDGAYKYNSTSGQLKLLGREFMVCAARDESSYKAIRGSTVGLWIGDEVTLTPKSFYEMAVTRMSLPGARSYQSTNPADPYHYIKKDWIDDPDKVANGDVHAETWTLEDNPNVSEQNKERLRRQFVGVFYQRNILGLWVIASGAIYRDVLTRDSLYHDYERPIALLSPMGHRERYISVDYGTVNPCVFLDGYDDGDVIWMDREFYYDSRTRMRQKTDEDYVNDMVVFANGGDPLNPLDRERYRQGDGRAWPVLIVDPSATGFIAALRKKGFIVRTADNKVSEGISMTATMLQRRKLRFNADRTKNTIREMETYSWNEDRADDGHEEPIKQNDHGPDAVRYRIKTTVNEWRLAA